MSWTELPLGPLELGLRADGVIEWNAALQLAMGDPTWVDVMWDATANTLGIRAVNAATGIPIYKEPDKGEYTLFTTAILATAGISVATNYTAEPSTWTETAVPGGQSPTWTGYQPIYYVTLP